MSSIQNQLRESKTQNWLKAVVAGNYTRTCLLHLVKRDIKQFHTEAGKYVENKQKATARKQVESNCSSCKSLADVLLCPTNGYCKGKPCTLHAGKRVDINHACVILMQYIVKNHRYFGPSWKTTDVTQWGSDPWSLARCFLPRDGYEGANTAEDTDLNGILSVIQNCIFFKQYVKDWDKLENSCEQARKALNKFRHLPTTSLSEKELIDYIGTLKKFLENSGTLKQLPDVQAAVSKLSKLEKEGDIFDTEELKEKVEEEIKQAEKSDSPTNIQDLQNLREELQRAYGSGILNIDLHTQKAMADIEAHVEKLKRRLSDMSETPYNETREAFQQDLITLYKGLHHTMPLPPRFPEIEMTDGFVPPYLTLRSGDNTDQRRRDDLFQPGRAKYKRPVKALDDMFKKGLDRAKHIYVTARAGFGKTAFCQFLLLIWSALKQGNQGDIDKLSSKGCGTYLKTAEVLKEFDFVFYVPLRRVRNLVHFEEMICHQIISNLERKSNYDCRFLETILYKESCLVILDGLDEWEHPREPRSDCYMDKCFLPHCPPRKNCTIMTTSRPWKISESKVRVSKHDNHVKIHKLDDSSSKILIYELNNHLNSKFNRNLKTSSFFNEIEKQNLKDLVSVPLMSTQLLSLWHDDRSLVDSRCHTYCSMIEMLFDEATQRTEHLSESLAQLDPITIPDCFRGRRFCQKLSRVLYDLAKLAFETTASSAGQIFYEDVVESCLTAQELAFALQTGLINKTHADDKVKEQNVYSFLHATYQEMLSCVYLASLQKDETYYETFICRLEENCRKDILTDMFIFFCGMDDDLAHRTGETISKLDVDELTKLNRIKFLDVKQSRDNVLRGYNEAIKNDRPKSSFTLHQVVGDQQMSLSHQLIPDDKRAITSIAYILHARQKEDTIEELKSILNTSCDSLVYVFVNGEQVENIQIMSESIVRCLKLHTLELRNIKCEGELDLRCCKNISSLTLKDVKLESVAISAEHLVFCFIRSTDNKTILKDGANFSKKLKELTMFQVKIDGCLNLSECSDLKEICLCSVDVKIVEMTKLHKIETCILGGYIGQWTEVFESLEFSTTLTEFIISGIERTAIPILNLVRLISNLPNIAILQLMYTDLKDLDLILPLGLRQIVLHGVKMSISSFERLLKSMVQSPQEVGVRIGNCEIRPDGQLNLKAVVKEIKECRHYRVDMDDLVSETGEFSVPRVDGLSSGQVNANVKSLKFHLLKND